VLEQKFADVGETQPEMLAQHLTDAGLAKRATPYWRRAGELAAGRSANLEAIAHLSTGLELVETLPNGQQELGEELALRIAIGGPLIATKGYPAAEVERTYSRASTLCDQLGRSTELFPVLRGLWNCYVVRGELHRADDLAKRLVVLAEEQAVPLRRSLARRARGTVLFLLGRFGDAASVLNEGIAIDDMVAAREDPAQLLLYAERAGVVCRLYSAWVLWYLGFPDRAVEMVEAGLALGQRLAQAHSLAIALSFAAILHNLRREFDAAHRRAGAAINLASEHQLPEWLAEATMCRGFALVGLGQQLEGLAQLRTGLSASNDIGAHLLDSMWLGFIAEAHLRAHEFEYALATLDRAAEASGTTGACHFQAELYRLRGTALVGIGDAVEATARFQQAIDTARSQHAKSLELRAATGLARLWAKQGRHTEAHDLLAPVYSWFTEGFDTPDLKDARALPSPPLESSIANRYR
jgi:predicted ATPase